MTQSLADAFANTEQSPGCPHAKATFEWWEQTRKGQLKVVKITAYRALFSNLVTDNDVNYKWLPGTAKPNTCLEVTVRYPRLMNDPNIMSALIQDRHGNYIFDSKHLCTQAFSSAISKKRTADGWCYETFNITFEEEQNPVFVSVGNASLSGFDLLRGEYINNDNDRCKFKVLQILIQSKDFEENQSGQATNTDCRPISSTSGLSTSNGLFNNVLPPVTTSNGVPPPAKTTSGGVNALQQQMQQMQLRLQQAEAAAQQAQAGQQQAIQQAKAQQAAA
jgi:hypothetical protein